MKIRDILTNLILTVILVMLLVIFADYVSANTSYDYVNTNTLSRQRQLGSLNRQEAILRHDYIRDTEQGIYRHDIERQMRELQLQQEATMRMLQFPGLIEAY